MLWSPCDFIAVESEAAVVVPMVEVVVVMVEAVVASNGGKTETSAAETLVVADAA